jgi:3-oxoacyl-[acyl-carrier-protein] synthase II
LKKRAVVTGVGVISSIGIGKEAFINGLRNGLSGIKPITYFDASEYRVGKAAIADDFTKKEYRMRNGGIETEISNVFALYAAQEAFTDAGLQMGKLDSARLGVSLATSLGGIQSKDRFLTNFHNRGYQDNDPYLVLETCSTTAGVVSKEFGCEGPTMTISTACAAGTNSIGYALDLIRSGECDRVIAGGADPFSRLSFSGFNSLLSITSTQIRPFDENRDGIDLGEGAAIVIIEELDTAIARGAKIYAEVLGYGISNDAYHATAPDPKAGGAIRAMEECLKDAGLNKEQINYINAHGTGTKFNDAMELLAIKTVFGERAKEIPISSSKSMFGHTLGCAGSLEFVTCVLAIKENFIPATINTEIPIKGYEDYDFVLKESRNYQVNAAISNSFAFAGNTASVAAGRFQE